MSKNTELYRDYHTTPDRIAHHAINNILEPIFVSVFTADTYSCIKGRGIHKASYNLRKALKDEANTKYCLKLDIKKYYPSIDNDILKSLLRKKFKDIRLLKLLDEIIDSYKGLPLGNLLSQTLGNYYLAYFDHWLKEDLKVLNYCRYCDDIVILHSSKEELHVIFRKIEAYLRINLKLQVKGNWQVFPVEVRGIDFCGYIHRHNYVLLRKRIKKRFVKAVRNRIKRGLAAYNGWTIHCNSINLRRKYEYSI